MPSGKLVLIIPKKVTEEGIEKLSKELEENKVEILGKDENLIIAKWDNETKKAVGKGLSIKSFHPEKIKNSILKELPESSARIGHLWNWSIDKKGKKVTEKEVNELMKKLHLEIKDDQVTDKLTKKVIGKLEKSEEEKGEGNWYLYQIRGWQRIPGWFGYWEKIYCWTYTYTNSTRTSRLTVDYLLAEVDGPNHYAWDSRYQGSVAYAEHWVYIWLGIGAGGTAHSHAREGSSSLDLTNRIL